MITFLLALPLIAYFIAFIISIPHILKFVISSVEKRHNVKVESSIGPSGFKLSGNHKAIKLFLIKTWLHIKVFLILSATGLLFVTIAFLYAYFVLARI